MFFQILSKVSVLFIVLFIGGLARYRKILTEDSTRALANIVLVIALPFLYFYSLSTKFTVELLETIWTLPIFAALFVLIAYIIARVLSRFVNLDSSGSSTFIYLSTFTNCGFLAIPIANALYGPDGIVRIVFFNVGFNLLYWTLGVWTLRSNNSNTPSDNTNIFSFCRNLINSGTIGLLCGIIVGLAALRLPCFVFDSANILGSATIPLALLVVGSIMSQGGLQKLRAYRKSLILIILCRLIILPTLALYITNLFSFLTPLSRAIIVLQSAMPSASTTPIFTTRFGGDSQLASAGVFATHICSIVTIPIFLSLL